MDLESACLYYFRRALRLTSPSPIVRGARADRSGVRPMDQDGRTTN